MTTLMRIDEALTVMADAAVRNAAAQERRADADERCAVAIERYAAAAERAALVAEENLRDGRASRVELHAFFDKLAAELLPVVTAKIESALGTSAEQADDAEDEEEEDEGQQPAPVAVEAPATPAPEQPSVEEKPEHEDEPAPSAKAELGEESDLDVATFLRLMRELNAKYALSEDLRKHIQHGIKEELGLASVVNCNPKMRRSVIEKYTVALKRLEKEGLTAEAPSETA